MDRFGVSHRPLDLGALVESVSHTGAGAVATFLGVSRRTSPDARNVDRPVTTLWYEAYEPMAVERLRAIGAEVEARHAGARVACWHRLGEVPVGEMSVVIAVSSPHRAAAFEACREVIEEIKRSVPVWKRERFADGEEWVVGHDGAAEDPARL